MTEAEKFRYRWRHVLNMQRKQLTNINTVWRGLLNLPDGPAKKDSLRVYLSMIKDLEDFQILSKMPVRFQVPTEKIGLMKLRGYIGLSRQSRQYTVGQPIRIKNTDIVFSSKYEAGRCLNMNYLTVERYLTTGLETKHGYQLVPATREEFELSCYI